MAMVTRLLRAEEVGHAGAGATTLFLPLVVATDGDLAEELVAIVLGDGVVGAVCVIMRVLPLSFLEAAESREEEWVIAIGSLKQVSILPVWGISDIHASGADPGVVAERLSPEADSVRRYSTAGKSRLATYHRVERILGL